MIFPKLRGLTRRRRASPSSKTTTNNDRNAESAPSPGPNSDEDSTPLTEDASWDGFFSLSAPNEDFGTSLWGKSGVCDVCGNLSAEELPAFFTHGACNVSAYRGCAPCKLLWKVCEPYLEEMAQVRLNSITVSLFEGTLFVSFERLGKEVRVYALKVPRLNFHDNLDTESPYPTISHYPLRFGVEDPAVAEEWIRNKLHICDSGHDICPQRNSTKQAYFPTRVVEILGPTQVRLFINDGKETSDRYACLSHCWGGVVPIQTTSKRLRDYQDKGIPWEFLPLTFKHAINITHRLGLKYLWIGSFCIVQDDVVDWRHEGSKMADIYSGSYITLAATSAPNSSAGLYQRSSANRNYTNNIYTIPGINSSENIYQISAREIPSTSPFQEESLPLQQRAWFFQERLLSNRIVHFADDGLRWECLRTAVSEAGHTSHSSLNKGGLHVQGIPKTGVSYRGIIGEEFGQQEMWHKTVYHYSKCQLTFPKDKLPALQGVAAIMGKERPAAAYYAGLWGDNMLYDLLWINDNPSPKRKQEEYRAPSWSWARSTGAVRWEPQDTNFHPEAEVVSVQTTPAGLDPMGEVTAGSLRIEGFCLPAIVKRIDEATSRLVRVTSQAKSSTESAHEVWWPDIDGTDLDNHQVTVMWIGWSRLCSYCLVFASVSGENELYERVGCVDFDRFSGWDSFIDGTRQALTAI